VQFRVRNTGGKISRQDATGYRSESANLSAQTHKTCQSASSAPEKRSRL
jgi:hypothetical protein